jgi:pre-mRNA-processing factor 6
MWLALAKLENYDKAKIVLNQARKHLPTDHSIWIHAAKLEESEGRDQIVIQNLLKNGMRVLKKHGSHIIKDEWILEAELAEKAGSVKTCESILRVILEDEEREEDSEFLWLKDAENLGKRGSTETMSSMIWFCLERDSSSKVQLYVNAI